MPEKNTTSTNSVSTPWPRLKHPGISLAPVRVKEQAHLLDRQSLRTRLVSTNVHFPNSTTQLPSNAP